MLYHLSSGTRTYLDMNTGLPPVRRTQNLQTIPRGRMQIFVYLTVEFIQTVTGKRSGAAEARWAHNPKVGGSKPPFAIFLRVPLNVPTLYFFLLVQTTIFTHQTDDIFTNINCRRQNATPGGLEPPIS